ncbi:MAG: hypothetical protein U0232_29410 [Thermomicrobiales bacterium]
MTIHVDSAFAPVDHDGDLERIGGGNETEVFRTDDQRHVVKLKHEADQSLAGALACARQLRATAAELAEWLGPRHTIPCHFYIARDSAGMAQVVVVQPNLRGARSLNDVDYAALTAAERADLADQLAGLLQRSRAMFRAVQRMPDLYGRSSASKADRKRRNSPLHFPWRLWSFLVRRNLLRSHNLMLTPDRRVVLVDYDPVRRSPIYKSVYYGIRRILFWRDGRMIERLRNGKAI